MMAIDIAKKRALVKDWRSKHCPKKTLAEVEKSPRFKAYWRREGKYLAGAKKPEKVVKRKKKATKDVRAEITEIFKESKKKRGRPKKKKIVLDETVVEITKKKIRRPKDAPPKVPKLNLTGLKVTYPGVQMRDGEIETAGKKLAQEIVKENTEALIKKEEHIEENAEKALKNLKKQLKKVKRKNRGRKLAKAKPKYSKY